MDELKLIKWKSNFEASVKELQTEYSALFLDRPLEESYTIDLNESNEWALHLQPGLPNEIKEKMEIKFLTAKPEDSI